VGARNRGGIGLSYWQARLYRLAELIPWNQFLGPINLKKYGFWVISTEGNGVFILYMKTQLYETGKTET
jgi:hypothetical protein